MSDMRIHHDTFYTEVTVRESDPYSNQAFLKLEAKGDLAGISGNIEHYMTLAQLEQLGHFLIEEARSLKIRTQRVPL